MLPSTARDDRRSAAINPEEGIQSVANSTETVRKALISGSQGWAGSLYTTAMASQKRPADCRRPSYEIS